MLFGCFLLYECCLLIFLLVCIGCYIVYYCSKLFCEAFEADPSFAAMFFLLDLLYLLYLKLL